MARVDDQQMHQARQHGTVAVIAFRMVSGEVNVARGSQRRPAGSDDDSRGAAFARNVAGIHQVTGATGVGDDNDAVVTSP